jgi:hypothetical protein
MLVRLIPLQLALVELVVFIQVPKELAVLEVTLYLIQ